MRATWPEGNGAGICFHLFSFNGISIFFRFVEPGGLQSMGSQSRTGLSTHMHAEWVYNIVCVSDVSSNMIQEIHTTILFPILFTYRTL